MTAGSRPDDDCIWHWCTPMSEARAEHEHGGSDRMLLHGRLIDHCAGLKDGSLFISVGDEYSSRVMYCPFCGCKERRA